ncbi:MAG: MBL fold metallo-hydrolase [Chloroflexota bacterium]
MLKLTILGSSGTVADAHHENAYMVLQGSHSSLLIDCAGSPMGRLDRIGVDLETLDGLLVTHHHPDHIYGVPVLLLGLWLTGREKPFAIFGSRRALDVIRGMMRLMEWQVWPDMFPVRYHEIPWQEKALVIDRPEYTVYTSPVQHLVPTVGVRIENKITGGVLAYSSDTRPCQAVVRLAQGADILIHEGNGPLPGHSTPLEAGEIAQLAGAKRLVLIHYPVFAKALDAWCDVAATAFDGPVKLAKDFEVFEF